QTIRRNGSGHVFMLKCESVARALVENLTWGRTFSHPGRAHQGFCLAAENVALYIVNPVGPYLALRITWHLLIHEVDQLEILLEDRACLLVATGTKPKHALDQRLPNDFGVSCLQTPRSLERLGDSARAEECSDVDAIIAVIALGGSGSQV